MREPAVEIGADFAPDGKALHIATDRRALGGTVCHLRSSKPVLTKQVERAAESRIAIGTAGTVVVRGLSLQTQDLRGRKTLARKSGDGKSDRHGW